MTPQIIGITGKTGEGKTTLCRFLEKDLHATTIHWDDFDDISSGPHDYVDWYKRGRDYSEWNYQSLAEVLQALKFHMTISHPTLMTTLHPTKFIVFDAPLGRLHEQTGQYIDVCIHIEVPLDVSLARRIVRDFKPHNKTKEDLLQEIEFYLTHSRPLYFDEDLKKTADLIIDGTESTKKQVLKIEEFISRF